MNINDTSENLFNSKGEITFSGWSRESEFIYNKESAHNPNKIWEHDCYYISNDDIRLYLAVETCGMELVIRIVLVELKNKIVNGDEITKRFVLSPQNLPQTSTLGEFAYTDKKIAITLNNTVEGRYIKCDFIDFCNIKNLYIKLLIKKTAGESLNIIQPIVNSRKNFFIKRFIPKFVAIGDIKFGGTQYTLTEDNSNVYFDWTRHFLPQKKEYQLLSGVFECNKHKFAINLASPVGNTKKGSENCFFYDRKLFKLDRFKVKGDQKKYQDNHYFLGNNGTELVFTPDSNDNKDMIYKGSKFTIVFGKLNGIVCHEDMDSIEITDKPAHMIFSTI